MTKKITYKFSVMNLILVNSIFPFNFFLRIKTQNPQQSQDSPIVQANSFQCDELFPWEFEISSTQVKVEFVEISRASEIQIIRSNLLIEDVTDENGETVVMLANRTSKRICIITYKLEHYNQIQIKTGRSKNEKKSDNIFDDSNQIPARNKMSSQQNALKSPRKRDKVIFSKEQHEELTKQIAHINKTIDKILDNEKSQHAIFNKYLEQSSFFLKEMMNQSRTMKGNSFQMNEIEEGDMEEKGNVSSILKGVRDQEELQCRSNNNSDLRKDQFNSQKWYKQTFNKDKPYPSKNINYRKEANSGPVTFELSIKYSEQYDIGSSGNQKSLLLSDIFFNSQVKPNEISFLDPFSQKLMLKVSSPIGQSYEWKKPIKLPPMDSIIIQAKNTQKKTQLKGCISKSEKTKEKVSLYDKKGDQKGHMKFKLKCVGTGCVQTQQLLKSIQKDQKDQKVSKDEASKEILNKVEGKVISRISDKTIIRSKEIKLKQATPTHNKTQQSIQSPQNISKGEKVQPYRRPSRVSRRSIGSNPFLALKNQNKRYEMQNKQEESSPSQQQDSKNQFVTNSVYASFLPYKKKQKYSISQKYDRSPFCSDEQQVSQVVTSKSMPRVKLVSFKVDCISVKISTKNLNDFMGKFIKLSIRNKSPYITQTINLSQNLIWKGKGFVFENVSPYTQLLVELYNDEKNQSILIGSAKICLALLNLHKNQIQLYHDYLRDQGENDIGELVLGYQGINQEKRRSYSLKQQRKIQFQETTNIFHEKKKKKNKTKPKGKSQVLLQATPQKSQKIRNIGLQGSQAKPIIGSPSIIRTNKYNGGNIIIGRAARFRYQYVYMPGPGQYQMRSSFQRHVSPL